MELALRVENLVKTFPGFRLAEVSLSLPRGYVMGFIGRNGAGKTTTIRLVMSLLRPDSGTIELFGRDAIREGARLRERIGFVYDDLCLYDGITVDDVRRFVGPFYRTWCDDRFRRYLRDFDLDPSAKTDTLSNGQKRKLALALALSHDAELLIMDEPTAGIDPVFRSELLDLLYEVIQDERRSVFFSTHITSDLERIADYITLIDGGRVLLSESKDALLERYRILRGPIDRLTAEARSAFIGVRETAFGFEALVEAEGATAPAGPSLLERASLEEIMVHMVRGQIDA